MANARSFAILPVNACFFASGKKVEGEGGFPLTEWANVCVRAGGAKTLQRA